MSQPAKSITMAKAASTVQAESERASVQTDLTPQSFASCTADGSKWRSHMPPSPASAT